MFYQIFLLLQVKRWAIITYNLRVASGVAQGLKTYYHRKLGNIKKMSKLHRAIA